MSEDWLNLTLEQNIALALERRWSLTWAEYIKNLLTHDDAADRVKEEIERAIEDTCNHADERSRTFHGIAFEAGLQLIACPKLIFVLVQDLAYNMAYYISRDEFGQPNNPTQRERVRNALAERTSIERNRAPALTDNRGSATRRPYYDL